WGAGPGSRAGGGGGEAGSRANPPAARAGVTVRCAVYGPSVGHAAPITASGSSLTSGRPRPRAPYPRLTPTTAPPAAPPGRPAQPGRSTPTRRHRTPSRGHRTPPATAGTRP